MMYLFSFFFGCTESAKVDEQVVPETIVDEQIFDNPTGELYSERFVVSSQLRLTKEGRIFVYDRETDRVVWSLDNEADTVWPDVRLSPDGELIYHNVVDVRNHNPNESKIVAVDVTGRPQKTIQTPGAHHSFDVLPDGSVVTIVTERRDIPGYGSVAGDKVVRYSDDGEEDIFNAFTVMEPAPLTEMWEQGYFEDAYDWTHGNCIRWYEEEQLFLLTVPAVNAIWAFDMEGQIQRVYLGKGMTEEPYLVGQQYQQQPYEIYSGGSFDMPHGATLSQDGFLWVMSNGIGADQPSYAEGYNTSAGMFIRQYQFPTATPNGHSAGLGGVLAIEIDDSVLINWGIYGVIEERNLQGEEQWRQEAALQEVYGISTTFDDMALFLD